MGYWKDLADYGTPLGYNTFSKQVTNRDTIAKSVNATVEYTGSFIVYEADKTNLTNKYHVHQGSNYNYTTVTNWRIGRRTTDGAVVIQATLLGKKGGTSWATQSATASWRARRSTESTAVEYYKLIDGMLDKTGFGDRWMAWYIDETRSKQTYIVTFDADKNNKDTHGAWEINGAWAENETLSVDAYGNMYVKVGSVWKDAVTYVKVNGVWKQANGYCKVGGSWHQ